MQDFKNLAVWHKAHALFLAVYRALGAGSPGSSFGLRTQALRAAASIPANIAEGCGKKSLKEFRRFIDIASGSSRELENHLIAARDIGAIGPQRFSALDDQTREVQRMLAGLAKAIRSQPPIS